MGPTVDFGVPFAGRGKNVRLANGEVELILPTEIGPRVLRYARVGGANLDVIHRITKRGGNPKELARGRWRAGGVRFFLTRPTARIPKRSPRLGR